MCSKDGYWEYFIASYIFLFLSTVYDSIFILIFPRNFQYDVLLLP